VATLWHTAFPQILAACLAQQHTHVQAAAAASPTS
jgi:hypothetical protein